MQTSKTSKFPHDRVVFFSDAVFAIAITLLVIEIKVPSHDRIAEVGLTTALSSLTPLFIGYVVSFLVAALFWKSHLQLGQHIRSFTDKLIWLNSFLLLFVALTPFSTALYSENFGSNLAFAFYCCNLAAIGIFSFFMHAYVVKHEQLKSKMGNRHASWYRNKILVGPIIFLLCIPLAYVSPLSGRLAFILIFVIQAVGERIYARQKTELATH